jgi:hypothetical protein
MSRPVQQEVRGGGLPRAIVGARVAGRRPLGPRVALGVACALLLTSCASATVSRLPIRLLDA